MVINVLRFLLQGYRFLNEKEIQGDIINDSIFDKYNFDQITANEYLNLLKTEKDNDEKILPLIDLKVKDEKGHLYFCPISAVYTELGLSIDSYSGSYTGWIVREVFNLKDIRIEITKGD